MPVILDWDVRSAAGADAVSENARAHAEIQMGDISKFQRVVRGHPYCFGRIAIDFVGVHIERRREPKIGDRIARTDWLCQQRLDAGLARPRWCTMLGGHPTGGIA